MIMGIILMASLMPVLLIVNVLFYPREWKDKDIVFGVRNTPDLKAQPTADAVNRLVKGTCKQAHWFMIGLILLGIALFGVKDSALNMTLWLLYFFGGIVLLMVPYAKANTKLKALKTTDDDDKYWKWGIFYNNPDDHRTSVEMRAGIGNTVNMATLGGKITVWFVVLTIIFSFTLVGYLGVVEKTPLELNLTSDQLICHQLKDDYKIDRTDIREVELLDELPDLMERTNGYGLDSVLKGKFTVDGQKNCRLFLNPNLGKYIKFSDGETTYYVSDSSDEGTLEIYNRIMK